MRKHILLFLTLLSFSYACGCLDPQTGPAAAESVKSTFNASDKAVSQTLYQIATLLKERDNTNDLESKEIEEITRLCYNNVLLYQKGTFAQKTFNQLLIKFK